MDDSGDGGGAAGMGCGLVGTGSEQVEKEDMEGVMYDDARDERGDVLFEDVSGRNLPLLSCCMVFAVIVVAKLGTMWSGDGTDMKCR
jgi:hypothetical protein